MSKKRKSSARVASPKGKRKPTVAFAGVTAGGVNKAAFAIYLERASVIYLALPLLIFFLGFLHIAWALPAAAALCAGVYFFLKTPAAKSHLPKLASTLCPPPASPGENLPGRAVIPWRIIAAAASASLAVCMLVGFGGFGEMGMDWEKHRAMLTHLTEQDWPVLVNWNGGEHLLVYYIAHYLPAAAAGKLFGFAAGNHLHLLWGALGITLSALWVFVFSRTAAWWMIAVFFLFSGPDIIAVYIAPLILPLLNPGYYLSGICFDCNNSVDPWTWGWSYEFGSHITSISWIPQHAIVGWLSAGLALHSIANGNLARRAVFFAPLSLLHSVFVTLWFLAFIALHGVWRLFRAAGWRGKLIELRTYFSPELLCALPPLLVLFAYYYSDKSASFMKFAEPGWNVFFGRLFILSLEFAVLWLLLLASDWRMRRADRGGRGGHAAAEGWLSGDLRLVFFLAMLSVLALSIFAYKDVQRNACIAPLFILMVCAIRMLEEARLPRRWRLKNFATAVVVLLCIGAWTPIVRMNSALMAMHNRGGITEWHQPVQPHSVFGKDVYTHQYLRSTDSWFSQHLAR